MCGKGPLAATSLAKRSTGKKTGSSDQTLPFSSTSYNIFQQFHTAVSMSVSEASEFQVQSVSWLSFKTHAPFKINTEKGIINMAVLDLTQNKNVTILPHIPFFTSSATSAKASRSFCCTTPHSVHPFAASFQSARGRLRDLIAKTSCCPSPNRATTHWCHTHSKMAAWKSGCTVTVKHLDSQEFAIPGLYPIAN